MQKPYTRTRSDAYTRRRVLAALLAGALLPWELPAGASAEDRHAERQREERARQERARERRRGEERRHEQRLQQQRARDAVPARRPGPMQPGVWRISPARPRAIEAPWQLTADLHPQSTFVGQMLRAVPRAEPVISLCEGEWSVSEGNWLHLVGQEDSGDGSGPTLALSVQLTRAQGTSFRGVDELRQTYRIDRLQ